MSPYSHCTFNQSDLGISLFYDFIDFRLKIPTSRFIVGRYFKFELSFIVIILSGAIWEESPSIDYCHAYNASPVAASRQRSSLACELIVQESQCLSQ